VSAASEALADVRGWLCDNLSEGDAGQVCGMLSAVSRHIMRLEAENARLDQRRIELHAEVEMLSGTIHRQRKQLVDVQDALERRNIETAELRKEREYLLANESPTACEVRRVRSAMKDVNDENAKLRELLHDAAIELYVNGNITDGATVLLFDQMRELGIEVMERYD